MMLCHVNSIYKELILIFSKASLFWFSVFVLIGCSCGLIYYGVSEESIKFIGIVLQLIGYAVTFFQIRVARKQLDDPGLLHKVCNFFKDIKNVCKKRSVKASAGCASLKWEIHGCTAIVINGPDLENKVESIEKIIFDLYKRLSKSEKDYKKLIGQLRIDVENRINFVYSELNVINNTSKQLSLDSVHLSFVGLIFFVVGIVLSSYPMQLANVFNGSWW